MPIVYEIIPSAGKQSEG